MSSLAPATRRCRGRCWFSVYGHPGLRSPVCVRCGRPNPKPLAEDELAEYDYWKAHRMAESAHPVRGQEWDRAEREYAALRAALADYFRALAACGVRADSMLHQHLTTAEEHIAYARP